MKLLTGGLLFSLLVAPTFAQNGQTIAIPNTFAVESAPPPAAVEFSVSSYSQTTGREQSKMAIERKLRIKGIAYNAVSYPSLRKFFARIREQDEQPVSLKALN